MVDVRCACRPERGAATRSGAGADSRAGRRCRCGHPKQGASERSGAAGCIDQRSSLGDSDLRCSARGLTVMTASVNLDLARSGDGKTRRVEAHGTCIQAFRRGRVERGARSAAYCAELPCRHRARVALPVSRSTGPRFVCRRMIAGWHRFHGEETALPPGSECGQPDGSSHGVAVDGRQRFRASPPDPGRRTSPHPFEEAKTIPIVSPRSRRGIPDTYIKRQGRRR